MPRSHDASRKLSTHPTGPRAMQVGWSTLAARFLLHPRGRAAHWWHPGTRARHMGGARAHKNRAHACMGRSRKRAHSSSASARVARACALTWPMALCPRAGGAWARHGVERAGRSRGGARKCLSGECTPLSARWSVFCVGAPRDERERAWVACLSARGKRDCARLARGGMGGARATAPLGRPATRSTCTQPCLWGRTWRVAATGPGPASCRSATIAALSFAGTPQGGARCWRPESGGSVVGGGRDCGGGGGGALPAAAPVDPPAGSDCEHHVGGQPKHPDDIGTPKIGTSTEAKRLIVRSMFERHARAARASGVMTTIRPSGRPYRYGRGPPPVATTRWQQGRPDDHDKRVTPYRRGSKDDRPHGPRKG